MPDDLAPSGAKQPSPFLSAFLEERQLIETEVEGLPFSARFHVASGEGQCVFTMTFRDGVVTTVVGGEGECDVVVRCSEEELRAVVEGKVEFIGAFSSSHIPLEAISRAPIFYAFFFPSQEFLSPTPVLREIYHDARYYPTITPPTQGYALYSLVVEMGLDHTMEVGLAYGGSALYFLAAHAELKRGRHVAMDPYQTSFFGDAGLDFVRRAGLEGYLEFRPTRSKEGMRSLANEGARFDLIYIDGEHALASVLSDFLLANDLLDGGSLLAFDDSNYPSGQRVLGIVDRQFDYEILGEYSTDRLTVLRKGLHKGPSLALRARVAIGLRAIPVVEGVRRVRIAALPKGVPFRRRRF